MENYEYSTINITFLMDWHLDLRINSHNRIYSKTGQKDNIFFEKKSKMPHTMQLLLLFKIMNFLWNVYM